MKKKIILSVLSIIIIIIAIFLVIGYKEMQYLKRTDTALSQLMDDKINLKDIDYNSLGEYGDSTKAFAETYTKFDTDIKNIEAEEKKYENINVFDVKYLENPEEGKEAADHVLGIIPQLEKVSNQDLDQLNKSFQKIPLPSKEKEAMYKDMDDYKTKSLNKLKPLETGLNILKSKIDDFYDFLISRKGKYTVETNKITFDSQQDVDKSNELTTAIQTAAKNIKY